MNNYDIAAIQASVAAIKAEHPELHGLLVDLADELDAAEIDTDSTLAAPAAALVAGMKTA